MNPARLRRAVQQVLSQGVSLLAEVDETNYATPLPAPFGASIGQHYRHVLDHFVSLLAGVNQAAVDYDLRTRSRLIETDLTQALRLTQTLAEGFRNLSPAVWQQRWTVNYSVGYDEAAPESLPSTFAREAAFCVGHAVHHYAIIRLLCAQWRVKVPPEFGIAPSTLKYNNQPHA
jgi:hypothetical protein